MSDDLTNPAVVEDVLRTDPTMKSCWCPDCRRAFSRDGSRCADCRRYAAIGRIVSLGDHWRDVTDNEYPTEGEWWDFLDAVADMLGTATRLRRAHNRELRDEQRAAQQDARASYDQGRSDAGGWPSLIFGGK